MNHCRDCNSDYSMPGTCNCFAVGGKRHSAPITIPYVPYVPYYPQPGYWPPYVIGSGSITVGDLPNLSTVTAYSASGGIS